MTILKILNEVRSRFKIVRAEFLLFFLVGIYFPQSVFGEEIVLPTICISGRSYFGERELLLKKLNALFEQYLQASRYPEFSAAGLSTPEGLASYYKISLNTPKKDFDLVLEMGIHLFISDFIHSCFSNHKLYQLDENTSAKQRMWKIRQASMLRDIRGLSLIKSPSGYEIHEYYISKRYFGSQLFGTYTDFIEAEKAHREKIKETPYLNNSDSRCYGPFTKLYPSQETAIRARTDDLF